MVTSASVWSRRDAKVRDLELEENIMVALNYGAAKHQLAADVLDVL